MTDIISRKCVLNKSWAARLSGTKTGHPHYNGRLVDRALSLAIPGCKEKTRDSKFVVDNEFGPVTLARLLPPTDCIPSDLTCDLLASLTSFRRG